MRVVKRIPKKKVINACRLKNEIEILRTLDHPNIIRLYEIFEDKSYLYLVMEYCEGGELFEQLASQGVFTEKRAHAIFSQVVPAIFYCHTKGICHRDLKLENFVLDSREKDPPLIKVIDFGFSAAFGLNGIHRELKTKVGSVPS